MGGGGGAPGGEGSVYGLLVGVEVKGITSAICEGRVIVKFRDDLASKTKISVTLSAFYFILSTKF